MDICRMADYKTKTLLPIFEPVCQIFNLLPDQLNAILVASKKYTVWSNSFCLHLYNSKPIYLNQSNY